VGTEKLYFEDSKVGDRIVSPARTITETDLVQFAALTGDWHPLHTNIEYAKESMFGERIAHGMLILAISSGLLFRTGASAVLPNGTIAQWGIDNVRFATPTKIGDTIHLEGEVVRLIEVDRERGLIIANHRVLNHRGDRVITFTSKMLVKRRPSHAE
jgi:3-hydroxybutyryl-CoA dehydratase